MKRKLVGNQTLILDDPPSHQIQGTLPGRTTLRKRTANLNLFKRDLLKIDFNGPAE